ncbi:MAG: tRNA (N6-isopentenyl adenosine(37)-C2)-methylthiotransferase MiaB [Candidatus Magasanikbacteria bacterium]|jgi:tRNA-2-methylthio-N6-dimethylallyladenosine synthase|nr:tRNA (N6-isopentenyl adenosine(37)-C2)-methylthiotransferase MiaB [Candidatus Magasanikbacteria bacterium]MBT4220685.1 tRNA (N6-isopentenyl adenosine(37)-C2)-methylthiotransferase MiaB [Candidatus Magasanikbacteria bacterium]MBT4350367.1 tRNA (N6-isopentenyl adenosine(37)-C2)-methylthiotransferase MiaB [Candidatus Magasanikbacteria bacterium]MBT4541755.1 tRNA (N6-isopentenyl adenosine(37)-C2)-methylthiotransferase MiaB [Candidatus Magasanikbacteria bacterium]MBT6252773.1 tRNA (N6-isopentenyl
MLTTSQQYSYHIVTFGCQMNKSDSERMATILENMGLKAVDGPEDADVVLLNSCSVRQAAEDRIFGLSRNLSKLKKEKPHLIVGVTGCMPGRDKKDKMGSKLKGVDLYFPTKDMIHLPKWLTELNPDLRVMENLKEDYLQLQPTYKSTFQAFVTIQTGCNHFCTYCVVPFSRGLEVNRSLQAILEECRLLAKNGYIEITLLGQIVNHYVAPDPEYFSASNPYKESDFAKLLWELNQIEGIKRIHYTAPHPLYMTDEVIDALTLPKQVNFLHLPVQSGNTDMLKKMNRRHDRELFIETIKKIREKKPNIAIGTDIIVGFCGETKEQFNDTVSLYEICDFDISYTAKYSERSGTVAAKAFKDDVTQEEKKKRWWKLQRLMEKIVLKKNQAYLDKEVSVLVDDWHRGWCSGNSSEMKRVQFKGEESLIGSVSRVKVYKAGEWMLFGDHITV